MQRAILLTATLLPLATVLAFAILSAKRRASANKQAMPAKGSMERSADLLSDANAGTSKMWLALLSTLLPIAGTAALLGSRWQSLPARFPIHWGFSGQPDGWSKRSPASVFGVLAFAFFLVLFFGLLSELIARSSPGHKGRTSMIATTRTILVSCAWLITALFCTVSLLPLTHDPTRFVPWITLASVLTAPVLIGTIAFRFLRMSDTVAAAQNTTDSRFWKAGIFYYNPADSALMVPKREGLGGYTMNFGRPTSWLLLAAILLLPLLLPLLLLHSSR